MLVLVETGEEALEMIGRREGLLPSTSTQSWFAKANHPRLAARVSGWGSRGWFAFADHDGNWGGLEQLVSSTLLSGLRSFEAWGKAVA